MKLTNHTLEELNAAVKTLIEFNKIFGSPHKNTELCFGITTAGQSIKIDFFIDYYEHQNNQDVWESLVVVRGNEFRDLIRHVQDVIEQYNNIEGYDSEEDYNYINDRKNNW
jgi:hypothetical protein